ncbi:hypothetical protein KAF25_000559 [Fusarium avenaceum]|uniref:Mid2 domain-containing protein n=1 Tax=Fusarium avenaceum TaxID=40199 RepID=A0A9P7GYF7_9HYPO|nr:hypothetical protein KAF25_000559 [Fusarium avenaceum]
MQLRRFLLLGMLLGVEGSKIAARQNTDSSAAASTANNSPATTAEADPTTEDAAATTAETDPTTAADPTADATTAADPSTDETTADGTTTAEDVIVTKTVTVTDSDAKTVSRQTTVMRTITSTVVVTSTAFETETVTSRDAKTATETTYVTSTKWANEKRAIDLAPRTIGGAELVAPPAPTHTTIPPNFDGAIHGEHYGLRAFRRGLYKRATSTTTVTVTEGDDTDTTVFNTISRTVISTISSATKTTKTITETEQADASTTTTVTSTLVVTSTRVTTGVVVTATVAPSGEYGAAGTGGASSDNNDSSSSSGGGDSGLSTGAKAGIGAGVGVAGLAFLAGLVWFCLRKRRNDKNKAEYDDVFGASEVPVGGRGGGGVAAGTSPHMSQASPAAASTMVPSRNTTKSSNLEGYRGTALGDGRAGFAKPQQFGRSYMPVSPETNYSRTAGSDQAFSAVTPENNYSHPAGGSPQHNAAEMYSPANTAELANDSAATKWHQNDAAEIDGNQVSSTRGSAPPEHVYEMPAQTYR